MILPNLAGVAQPPRRATRPGRRLRQAERAFTLIELIISSGLMSVILASAYLCLNAGFVSERMIETRAVASQTARVALNLIAADLRAAVPLSKEYEFVGMRRLLGATDADNLDFGTRNYRPRNLRDGDFCETSYFLVKEQDAPTGVLYRRRDPTPDPEPLQGGSREEIARGVTGLRFEYYDGYEWYDEWGDPQGKQKFATIPEPNVSGLPEAVRITLTVDPDYARPASREESRETAITLQTIARVNLALFFYRSSGGGGATNANPAGGQTMEVSP